MNVCRILILSFASFCIGCASEPVAVTYYLLAPPDNTVSESTVQSNKPTVVIENVEVAEFLRQPGLLIQAGNNQLNVSRNHLWAESLERSLPKALLQELRKRSSDYDYFIRFTDFLARTDYRLRLQFDNMQASDQGLVLTSGRYQLITSGDENNSIVSSFYFNRDLEEDGYPHAVAQMQVLIGQLADAILRTLDDMQ